MYYKKSKCESKFYVPNLSFALTREIFHLSHKRSQTNDTLFPNYNYTQTPLSVYMKSQEYPQENPQQIHNTDALL